MWWRDHSLLVEHHEDHEDRHQHHRRRRRRRRRRRHHHQKKKKQLRQKELRPWEKDILFRELVSDRDERDAQRRFTVPGTSGHRRDAESPVEDGRPSQRMRPWDESGRRMEHPPQRSTELRRDAEEEDRSNQKRIVTGLRRDPDYSRPAGGARRPSKFLKK